MDAFPKKVKRSAIGPNTKERGIMAVISPSKYTNSPIKNKNTIQQYIGALELILCIFSNFLVSGVQSNKITSSSSKTIFDILSPLPLYQIVLHFDIYYL